MRSTEQLSNRGEEEHTKAGAALQLTSTIVGSTSDIHWGPLRSNRQRVPAELPFQSPHEVEQADPSTIQSSRCHTK